MPPPVPHMMNRAKRQSQGRAINNKPSNQIPQTNDLPVRAAVKSRSNGPGEPFLISFIEPGVTASAGIYDVILTHPDAHEDSNYLPFVLAPADGFAILHVYCIVEGEFVVRMLVPDLVSEAIGMSFTLFPFKVV